MASAASRLARVSTGCSAASRRSDVGVVACERRGDARMVRGADQHHLVVAAERRDALAHGVARQVETRRCALRAPACWPTGRARTRRAPCRRRSGPSQIGIGEAGDQQRQQQALQDEQPVGAEARWCARRHPARRARAAATARRRGGAIAPTGRARSRTANRAPRAQAPGLTNAMRLLQQAGARQVGEQAGFEARGRIGDGTADGARVAPALETREVLLDGAGVVGAMRRGEIDQSLARRSRRRAGEPGAAGADGSRSARPMTRSAST